MVLELQEENVKGNLASLPSFFSVFLRSQYVSFAGLDRLLEHSIAPSYLSPAAGQRGAISKCFFMTKCQDNHVSPWHQQLQTPSSNQLKGSSETRQRTLSALKQTDNLRT